MAVQGVTSWKKNYLKLKELILHFAEANSGRV
jgi:hypothetical protein